MASTVGLRLSLVVLLICAVYAKKTSQGTQTEPPKKVFDFDALSVQDLLRCGVVSVLFIIIGLSDKRGEIRNWQTLESVLMFAQGCAFYFFPEEILGHAFVGTINKYHMFLAQSFGAINVGFAFITYLLVRNGSRDSLVRSSWLLSRVVLYSTALICNLHTHLTTYTGPQHMSNANLLNALAGLVICIIFSLYHIMRSGGTSRKRTGQLAYSAQTCILLMMIIHFVLAMTDLLQPTEAINEVMGSGKSDVLTSYLVRASGIFSLAVVVQLIASLRFDDDEDRMALFKGNLLTVALVLPLIALQQWKDPVLTQRGVYASVGSSTFMAMLGLCVINRCLPACLCSKTKTR
eukprot:GHVO01047947.1.p1 GENE.GHVO01047947.1~~GHVO01047947.1.p1  ORF type:complete len:348 (-),score=24.03 GHVO01047947.1:584-1627(-)